MRQKIKQWEALEKQKAIQKALYHHLSKDNLNSALNDFSDYADREVDPEVAKILRKFDTNMAIED